MTTSPSLPDTPSALTPQFLSRVLDRDVTDCRVRRIGEDESFTGGGLYQISLSYGQTSDGPASVVVKFSPTDGAMRTAFAASNQREVACYSHFAQNPDLPVPRSHFGHFDPETGASLLVIEDLADYRTVSFLTGCDAADTARTVDALARIHATYWDHPDVAALSGAAILQEFDFRQCWAAYPQKLAQLLPDQRIPASFARLCDHIADHQEAIFHALMEQGPLTFLHRDIHVDNVLFARDNGGKPAVILDWQISGKGKGVADLSYFLISSLTPDTRRAVEGEMLRRYHAALLAQGVTGYGFEACAADYLLGAVVKIYLTVGATALLDNSTPHKRAWRQADLTRLLAFCDDHRITPQLLAV